MESLAAPNHVFHGTLCICTNFPGQGELVHTSVSRMCGDHFNTIVVSTKDVATELREVKESGAKVILCVLGPLGHDAIKYMCDDFENPVRRVEWIHSMSVGYDAYRLGELTKEIEGIPITTGRGSFSPILAEHVMYSMLYFSRHTARIQKSRTERKWDVFDMIELRGKTMSVFGYGDIGHACARLARAFGMNVLGVKRTPPAAPVDDLGVNVLHGDEGTERALRESDFVVNVLPGVKSMHGFFNKDTFAKMKPTSVYINIGRGVTQVEADIYDALNTGVIAGAAVDVFEKEPLPEDSLLWSLGDDKILITAHTACRSTASLTCVVQRFVTLAKEYLATNSLEKHVVDINEHEE